MSGKWFNVVSYGVRQQDQRLDMDDVRAKALEHRPKLILAGGTAYSRLWDWAAFRAIADEVVVMQRGRVVEQGPKDEMFQPPHHPYTDLLLSSVPEMDPNWLTALLEERGVDNVGEAAKV